MRNLLDLRPLGASPSYWLMLANHTLLLTLGFAAGVAVGRRRGRHR